MHIAERGLLRQHEDSRRVQSFLIMMETPIWRKHIFAGVSTNLGFPVEEVNESGSNKTTTTSQRDSYLGGLLLRRLPCSRFERIGLLRLDLHHNDDPCVDLPEREITII
jgi:hypothetical protein